MSPNFTRQCCPVKQIQAKRELKCPQPSPRHSALKQGNSLLKGYLCSLHKTTLIRLNNPWSTILPCPEKGSAPTLCKSHCTFNLLFLTQQQLWIKEPKRTTSGIHGAATAGLPCSRDAEILVLQTWFCPGVVTATHEINSWKWCLCKCSLNRKFILKDNSCWSNFSDDTWLFLVISCNSSQLSCAAIELELWLVLFCTAVFHICVKYMRTTVV